MSSESDFERLGGRGRIDGDLEEGAPVAVAAPRHEGVHQPDYEPQPATIELPSISATSSSLPQIAKDRQRTNGAARALDLRQLLENSEEVEEILQH